MVQYMCCLEKKEKSLSTLRKSQGKVAVDEKLMDRYIKAAKCFVTLGCAEFTRLLK